MRLSSPLRAAVAAARMPMAALLLLGVAGCSAMSDEPPPPEDASAATIPPPETNESFPNLGSVPDQAPEVPSATERQEVIEGLSSDRANAKYTDQDLRGQPSDAALPPPEPAPPPETISTEPPPQAAPTEPVESAPIEPAPSSSEAAPDPASSPTAAASEPSAEPTPPEPAESVAAEPVAQIAPPPYEPAEEAAPSLPEPAAAEVVDAAPPAEALSPAPAEPAPAPLTQATSTMTPPPPAAPPPSSAPTESGSSSLPMPGQPGTVVLPPSSTRSTAAAPPPPAPVSASAAPATGSAAITSTPLPAPTMAGSTMPPATASPMPMPTQTASLPVMQTMPQTTVISSAGTSGGGSLYQPYQPQPYQQPSAMPTSYAGNAVTVDMGAVNGGGAPSFYPTAMSQAYVAPPTQNALAQPALRSGYAAGAAGGPAGIIYFSEGGSKLDAADRDVLKSVAAIYRQRGGIIRVVGHSSQDGASSMDAQQANLQLSWSRANAVAKQLAREGVDPGAIQADALGANQPLYLESSAAGAAANRRVEIYFY